MSEYEVITKEDYMPTLRAPNANFDLPFYQTKETLIDPERYHAFIMNAERRFRASNEYKSYKAYLMSLGFDHCQSKGNIEASEMVDIELHHNILNLFDILMMISEHVLITVGYISTFDLIQLCIGEHFANRVPCTFLSTTIHQNYTDDPEGYIPPDQTFGKWWELITRYKYGITYDIAQKIIKYINKYQDGLPSTINIPPNEEILSYAYYNQYGVTDAKLIPENMIRLEDNSYRYGNMDYNHRNYIGVSDYQFY